MLEKKLKILQTHEYIYNKNYLYIKDRKTYIFNSSFIISNLYVYFYLLLPHLRRGRKTYTFNNNFEIKTIHLYFFYIVTPFKEKWKILQTYKYIYNKYHSYIYFYLKLSYLKRDKKTYIVNSSFII